MKKLITSYLTILLSLTYSAVPAQTTVPQQIARRIATKMQDSLLLTNAQKESIYQANLQLHAQKMLVRQRFTQADSVRVYVQQIENTRDNLYRNIMGNEEKYNLYKQKKKNLISAN